MTENLNSEETNKTERDISGYCSSACYVFNQHRRDQLDDLFDLLHTCNALNNGSGAIDKISKIIKTADKLTSSDMKNGKQSFVSFLNEVAWLEKHNA